MVALFEPGGSRVAKGFQRMVGGDWSRFGVIGQSPATTRFGQKVGALCGAEPDVMPSAADLFIED